jgi:hypothetical protein
MQITSHVNICHDHGPAAQHDVWFAFDFGLARDFVSSILSATFSELLPESSQLRDLMLGFEYEYLHGRKHSRPHLTCS